jgi:antitoxin (DNA-binding transcriptional repressor) of toxin-antitoxin stability system
MQTVNIHEAKAQLSRLVDQAAGEEIIVARATIAPERVPADVDFRTQ